MITEEQILRQRRRPHRAGLKSKSALIAIYKTKEWYRVNKWQRERSESVNQEYEVTNATEDIVIPQTEARDAVGYYEFKPGVYDATVAHIESVDNPFEDDKQQLEFTFEITGFQNEDGSPATRRSWANPVFNSKSKLYGWCVAILGDDMPAKGEPFRTSLLIGRGCQVVLNAGTNQSGEKIVKLTDILPPKEGQPKPGLVASLKKGAVPPKADVVDFDMCSAAGCAMKADQYTSKGTPFCEAHMP